MPTFDQDLSFDQFIPHWYGIVIEGGAGFISKNLIKLKSVSYYLFYSVGITLMKRDPAHHLAGLMVDLHDVEVLQTSLMEMM